MSLTSREPLSVLDDYKIAGNGEIRINCPECGNTKYKLYVSLKKGKWNCFRCGYSGSWIPSLERELAFRMPSLGKQWRAPEITPSSIKAPRTSPLTQEAIAYLKNRGVTKSQITAYNLRMYNGRISFPIMCGGFQVGMTCRTIREETPKYLAVGDVKGHIFGYDMVECQDFVYIVEGPFNVLSLGRGDAVAILGTKATDAQIEWLINLPCPKLVVALDPDANMEAYDLAKRLGQFTRVDIRFGPEFGKRPTRDAITKNVKST